MYSLSIFDDHFLHLNIQQPRRRLSVPFAPHVSPSVNPPKRVAVVVGALGLEPAEALATKELSTRGTKAFGPAKHRIPRQGWGSSYLLFNKNNSVDLPTTTAL